jgi:hypothetical protein
MYIASAITTLNNSVASPSRIILWWDHRTKEPISKIAKWIIIVFLFVQTHLSLTVAILLLSWLVIYTDLDVLLH